MSKLLLTIVTGGFTLLGVILFASNQNIQENYLPAVIEQAQQIQEVQTPTHTPSQNTKASLPLPIPTPVIIHVTIAPTPAPLETSMPAVTPTSSFSPLPTNAPISSFTPTLSSTPVTGHIFYTSSHWKAKYYYCDTDSEWESLSEKYLQVFNSEEELLQNYDRIIYEPCKDQ